MTPGTVQARQLSLVFLTPSLSQTAKQEELSCKNYMQGLGEHHKSTSSTYLPENGVGLSENMNIYFGSLESVPSEEFSLARVPVAYLEAERPDSHRVGTSCGLLLRQKEGTWVEGTFARFLFARSRANGNSLGPQCFPCLGKQIQLRKTTSTGHTPWRCQLNR